MASTKDCLDFILEQFRSERLSEVTTRHQLGGIQRMFEKAGFIYRGEQRLYAENTGMTEFLYYEKVSKTATMLA